MAPARDLLTSLGNIYHIKFRVNKTRIERGEINILTFIACKAARILKITTNTAAGPEGEEECGRVEGGVT